MNVQVVTPQSELYEKLLQLGWNLKKVDFKNGVYVAKAESKTTGQDIERVGQSPEMAVAAVFQFAQRANAIRRYAALQKIGAWDSDWLDKKDDIAKAYSEMPAFDEKAVPAWKALAAESKTQADAIRQQITVEVVDDSEPYMSAQEMCEDIHKNRHFKVSRANSEHAVWSQEDNVNFRIVHDVLGHCQSGGDFSWRGENLACGVHFPLVSPLAREALFTECIGQVAYRSYFKGFGPQKIGLLSQFLHPVQEKNGEHIWVPHGGLPTLTPSPNANQGKGALDQAAGMQGVFNSPGDWVNPSQFSGPQAAPPSPAFEQTPAVMQGFRAVTKNVSPNRPYDPNQFWTPTNPVPPLEDPAQDYIDIGSTVNNASKVDTQWQHEDEATQKQAIMNAFRVALLSPRKHLKWNAAHYQALMHSDPATKSVDLWNKLETEREKHNQKLGYPEGSHLAYRKQLTFLAHKLQEENGWVSEADALKEAKRIIFEKTKEFEEELGKEQEGETSELKRYNIARRMVTDWMRENYTPARGWQPGQMALAAETQTPQLFQMGDDWQPVTDDTGFASNDSKYGAFMGAHLDGIEQVGKHIDQIRDAALKDLDDGGKGFTFRNAVMNMNLPGVNPKVASFAWLLLAPMSSELGIIDTHVLRGLRRDESQNSVRDYYKHERMQRAAKDSTGYGHMPLGMYHWGLWDQIRNPGEHSDHSPLRVLDPLPWDSPEAKWDAASSARSGPWTGPMQFENARGHMERAARDFDQEMAGQPHAMVPLGRHPGQALPGDQSAFIIPASVKLSSGDPDYLFVYYKSELRVVKWESGLRQADMLSDLLDEFGVDMSNVTLDIDPNEVAAGEIYDYDERYLVEHKQLSNPDVREKAEELIREWHRDKQTVFGADRDPNTGQFT
jgi:hypothetical protein